MPIGLHRQANNKFGDLPLTRELAQPCEQIFTRISRERLQRNRNEKGRFCNRDTHAFLTGIQAKETHMMIIPKRRAAC